MLALEHASHTCICSAGLYLPLFSINLQAPIPRRKVSENIQHKQHVVENYYRQSLTSTVPTSHLLLNIALSTSETSLQSENHFFSLRKILQLSIICCIDSLFYQHYFFRPVASLIYIMSCPPSQHNALEYRVYLLLLNWNTSILQQY